MTTDRPEDARVVAARDALFAGDAHWFACLVHDPLYRGQSCDCDIFKEKIERLQRVAAESAERQLAERDERIRALVELVRAGLGSHGELCSDWDNCTFVRDARAALAEPE